jgi:tRNA (guanine37-N1)-methyltransferase
MLFDILTLFPQMFAGAFSESIIARAVQEGIVSINLDNIRDYTTDKHRKVDDYPYGGDPGMLMKPEPLTRAICAARQRRSRQSPKVVFLTPQGALLTQDTVKQLAAEQCLILVCGHYKGIDQRIRDKYVDLEISVGDYVVSGGEVPAMMVVDAVTRLLPGALGNEASAGRDSHFDGLLAPPEYTRPEEFEGMKVPEVLLSGHHERIRQWQQQQAIELTKAMRPDLWQEYLRGQQSAVSGQRAQLREPDDRHTTTNNHT